MPRKRYNALDRLPLSAVVSLLAAGGRLAKVLQSVGKNLDAVPLPLATPVNDVLPLAEPLRWPPEDWAPPDVVQGLVQKLREAENDLRREKSTDHEAEMPSSPPEEWAPPEAVQELVRKLREAEDGVRREQSAAEKIAAELAEVDRLRGPRTTAMLITVASEENKQLRVALDECNLKMAALMAERDQARKELNELNRELVRKHPHAGRARGPATPEEALAGAAISHGAQRLREEALARVFRLVFPGLDFTRGSIYFLVQRAHNLQQTYGKLSELNSLCRVEGARRVQSTKSWFEVRYGKEGSSVDRMYYSYSSGAGRSLVVLSNKEKQDSDQRKLRRATLAGE